MTAHPEVDLGHRFVTDITSVLPTNRKLARPVNTRAFVGTNPTGELITSGLSVTREQAGSLNAGTCIAILPEVPHLEQQAIPRAAIPNCTNHFSA